MRTLAIVTVMAATVAHADGERTPMIGGAAVWTPTSKDPAGMGGVELEAAWWRGRIGLAAEGSARWSLEGDSNHATALGGSLRLRVLEMMMPSLVEPRDVEVALELQGIAERIWQDGLDPYRYGVGLALRVRGGAGDAAEDLMSESRFFVRVLSGQSSTFDVIARASAPVPAPPRELAVLIGIGAAWGEGDPYYVDRFRLRPWDWMLVPSRGRR